MHGKEKGPDRFCRPDRPAAASEMDPAEIIVADEIATAASTQQRGFLMTLPLPYYLMDFISLWTRL
jgi:hypothetical protein